MRTKWDLHVHTLYSRDCCSSLEEIIETCQRKDISGIAVTDHNTIQGALKLREIVPSSLLVIVGEEIKTLDGEITGLFLEEEIPGGLTTEETIAKIKTQNGLVCIPHPFDRLRHSKLKTEALLRIINQADLIEVFNSRNVFTNDNEKAQTLANSKGLTTCVGSDAHTPCEIGMSYVEMEHFSTSEEFLHNLASAKSVTRKSSFWVHITTKWTKLTKKFSGCWIR